MMTCKRCNKFFRAETSVYICSCGYTNRRLKRNRYTIDFTLKKHGDFVMYAVSEEEAALKFKTWVETRRADAERFMENLVFDTEITKNYIVSNA